MPSKFPKGYRSAEVTEAPTYYPSEAEFADPLAFIARIRPEAERYGACKIVPPPGWKLPFVLDKRSFRFNTRIQSVHELQERSTAEDHFEEDYHDWLRGTNRSWKGPPMFNGREVDLYRLFKVVAKRGGYERVSESKAWKEVCRILQVRLRLRLPVCQELHFSATLTRSEAKLRLLGVARAICQRRGRAQRSTFALPAFPP